MVENIFYLDAKKSIRTFIDQEYPSFETAMLNKLLDYFYKFLNYEEEGIKIRPSIIFTNNINFVCKTIPNVYKLVVYRDEDASLFNHRIKTLVGFCRNEWAIFINQSDDYIEYGLVKALNSIKEQNIKELIFNEEVRRTIAIKSSLITLEVINKSLITLQGVRGHTTNVSFSFSEDSIANWNDVIKSFVEVSVSKLKTTKKKLEEIKILYENIFKKVFKNLHGAICLVVDKDYKPEKDTTLLDGTWLEQPIQLSKLFLQTKSYSEAKLIGISDLIIAMLNYDGATIVDNAGRIRAYNVFVENKIKNNIKPIGGARRRAAQTLIDSKNKKFIGVYFQSQDGETFFRYVGSKQNVVNKKPEELKYVGQSQNNIKGQISISEMVNQPKPSANKEVNSTKVTANQTSTTPFSIEQTNTASPSKPVDATSPSTEKPTITKTPFVNNTK